MVAVLRGADLSYTVQQQLGSIDLSCRLAAYFCGRVGLGQRCCWPLNADPLAGELVHDLPSPQDDQDRRLLADVSSCGWHVIKVPECGSTPGWAFSVGLYHTFEHPEVILFGLPIDTMHQIIHNIAEDIRGGGTFPPDSESTEILEGYTCSLRSVEKRWYRPFLGYATWLYQGTDFPVVQCLWPDRAGALPDDPSFDSDLIHLQPLLWRAEPSAARAEELLHSLDT